MRYLHVGVELSTTTHFLERIIGEHFTRNLDDLNHDMHDELRFCIDAAFGINHQEWREVNVYDSLQNIVMPAMNRIFFGLPLCRDPHVSRALRRYILALGFGTIIVGELPRMLKGLIARFVRVPLNYYRNQTMSVLVPVVERQLARGTKRDGHEESEKRNFIRQCIKISERSTVGGVGTATRPEVIVEWILSLVRKSRPSSLSFQRMHETAVQLILR